MLVAFWPQSRDTHRQELPIVLPAFAHPSGSSQLYPPFSHLLLTKHARPPPQPIVGAAWLRNVHYQCVHPPPKSHDTELPVPLGSRPWTVALSVYHEATITQIFVQRVPLGETVLGVRNLFLVLQNCPRAPGNLSF